MSGKTVCSPQLKVNNYSAQIRGHSQVTDKTGVEYAERSRMSSGVYIVLWAPRGGGCTITPSECVSSSGRLEVARGLFTLTHVTRTGSHVFINTTCALLHLSQCSYTYKHWALPVHYMTYFSYS